MIKIAHISDIHIRKLKYHEDYRLIFEELYTSLRAEAPDLIINTGDIFHVKSDLSPESVQMMSDLFLRLAEIAPHHLILGNHDTNLRNGGRLDAISPVVNSLDHPNIFFHKHTTSVEPIPGCVLNILSIVDPENWKDPENKEKINIALYHGAVVGSTTDIGWAIEHGDIDVKTLEKYDFALLGDIHKTNQSVDAEGRIRYAGSLIQQGFGESNDKGYLVWEIKDKDNFNVRHIKLKNQKPFITIELTNQGKIPKLATPPEASRLRLVSNNNLPLDRMKRAVDVAKSRFKPTTITFLNRAIGDNTSFEEFAAELGEEDLRDVAVQEELMNEYLQDYEVDTETMEKIFKLNRRYNTVVEDKEEISRNVKWKLKSLEWDNLFNYGEGNYIDFEKLNGTVGIFGKNFSGKSSIIDSILYTIFNSTSKNERKNLNVINQNKEYGQGRAVIEIDGRTYTILRQSEKYSKKLRGKEAIEAKTNVEFSVYDPVLDEVVDLNGPSRASTDKNIRKTFGTLEDFLMTSMTSQHGAFTFIQEGSTKRKEIMAKFLDLEIFDRKFKMAKDEVTNLRGALKRLEGKEYDADIEVAATDLQENERFTEEQQYACEQIEQACQLFRESLQETSIAIASVPTKIIDVVSVRTKLKNDKFKIKSLENENVTFSSDLTEKEEKIKKINKFIQGFDLATLQNQKEEAEEISKEASVLRTEITRIEESVARKKNKISLLDEVPCGIQYADCKFISNAHEAKITIKEDNNSLAVLKVEDLYLAKQLRGRDLEVIEDQLHKYELLLNKRINLEDETDTLNLNLEKNKAVVSSLYYEVQAGEVKVKEYEQNKDAIENFEELLTEKARTENNIFCCEKEIKICKENTLALHRTHGSLEQKLKNLKEIKQELEDLRTEYTAYDLFMRCMHSNGISYDIIKRRLPVINNEVAKVLANIVEFEIFFEEDGKKLNLLIKHPHYDPRPLEMGSGAEKTIAATAIRLALLSVSNLPQPNIVILDEPGTALDEGNMEGFTQILDLVKSYFGTVLLISHLDSLKDCVDKQITIDKEGDYAHVNHRN